MTQPTDHDALWKAGIAFWCDMWQAQMETGLRFWAAWAQVLPHDSARDLSAEADAMKPAKPAAKTRRPAGTAPKTAPRKPAARRPRKPATA